MTSARGRRCSANVTSKCWPPIVSVPAPVIVAGAAPSAASSPVSVTSPSRDSDAASIVTCVPATVSVFNGISAVAVSPLVDPVYVSLRFAIVRMIGLVTPGADVSVPRQLPATGSAAAPRPDWAGGAGDAGEAGGDAC